MNREKLVFVYRSAKGFEKFGQYGHPVINVYVATTYKPYRSNGDHYVGFQEILTITGQIDNNTKTPYALKFEIENNNNPTKGLKFLNALYKKFEYGVNYKTVIKFLKQKKVERYIHSKWISTYQGIESEFIPYSEKNHVDLYLSAMRAGKKITSK